jgi:hypothetical protein
MNPLAYDECPSLGGDGQKIATWGCVGGLLMVQSGSASLRKANSDMRDKINSADQSERSKSLLTHSTFCSGSTTKDVMGHSGVTGYGLSQSEPISSITAVAVSTDTFGAINLQPSDLDSDAVWVAMQKQQSRALVHQASRWSLLRLGTTDQQRDEVQNANRIVFVDLLKKSYAKRSDTILWSMMVFILTVIILIPLRGFIEGPAFAAFVCLCWTAVHRVRRL